MNDIPYKNVCRICLVDNEQMASIYNGIIKETGFITYREMLEDCASVKVSDVDITTKMICSNCSTDLEKNHTFRIQCINSHKILTECAKQGPFVKLEIIESKSDNTKYSENNSNLKLENETKEIENNISTHLENIVPKEEVNFVENDNQEEISDVSSDTDNSKIKNFDDDFTWTVNFLPGKKKPSRTYKCNRCEKTFNLKIDSVRHLRLEHSDDSPLICTICNKKFAAKCTLTLHMATHGYNCKICLLSCETADELEEHKKTHSNDSGFVCRECGKPFSKIVGLRGHYLRAHTEEKRHLCTYCGKFFSDRQNLVAHLRIHTGDKPFTCKLCGASFNHPNSLRRHMVCHSSEKNYECKTCNKTFARLQTLRTHMRSHDDVRNFACTICSRRFKDKSMLKNHHLTHTGQRNFTCTTCNKSFFRRYHLKVHQRSHTGERPYTCSECGKTFTQKHLRDKHLKSIHSKSVPNDTVLLAGAFTSNQKEELH